MLKLTKSETQHFNDLVEALQTARDNLEVAFSNLDAELEVGSRDYDGEKDREDIGTFQWEIIVGLGYEIEDMMRDWQCRLDPLKDRFKLEFDLDGETELVPEAQIGEAKEPPSPTEAATPEYASEKWT